MFKHVFETTDHDLFLKILAFVNAGAQAYVQGAAVGGTAGGVVAAVAAEVPAVIAALAPPPPPAPVAASAPPPPPAAAAPPPPAPAPAPVAVDLSRAPAGWTVDHVKGAATALAQNAAKGGPGKVKEILGKFAARKIDEVDPARWPEFYEALSAAVA